MTKRTAAPAAGTPDLLRLTTSAVVTALIFLFTFLVKIPTGVGYIHLGDAFVLLYAAATGDPLALFAGALGEALADIAGGYAPYAPVTAVIKVLIALPMVLSVRRERGAGTRPSDRKLLTRNTFLWSLLSVPVTLGGYFLIDYALSGAYAFPALWTNGVQAAGSVLLFAVLGAAFDRSSLSKRLR